MTAAILRPTPVVVLLAILATGCSFGPPPSCGDDIGGTADPAVFDQYFNSMLLVSQTTGQPGPDGENGAQFAQGDPLAMQTDAKSEVEVRACVQPRSGQGEIPLDLTQTLPQGQGTLPLGTYEPGAYVIRVIVGKILVKNLTFEVR